MAKEDKKAVALQETINDYAKEAAKSPTGEKLISLVDRHKIKFTKDFGFMKVGQTVSVSEMAKDHYLKNEVAELVK